MTVCNCPIKGEAIEEMELNVREPVHSPAAAARLLDASDISIADEHSESQTCDFGCSSAASLASCALAAAAGLDEKADMMSDNKACSCLSFWVQKAGLA